MPTDRKSPKSPKSRTTAKLRGTMQKATSTRVPGSPHRKEPATCTSKSVLYAERPPVQKCVVWKGRRMNLLRWQFNPLPEDDRRALADIETAMRGVLAESRYQLKINRIIEGRPFLWDELCRRLNKCTKPAKRPDAGFLRVCAKHACYVELWRVSRDEDGTDKSTFSCGCSVQTSCPIRPATAAVMLDDVEEESKGAEGLGFTLPQMYVAMLSVAQKFTPRAEWRARWEGDMERRIGEAGREGCFGRTLYVDNGADDSRVKVDFVSYPIIDVTKYEGEYGCPRGTTLAAAHLMHYTRAQCGPVRAPRRTSGTGEPILNLGEFQELVERYTSYLVSLTGTSAHYSRASWMKTAIATLGDPTHALPDELSARSPSQACYSAVMDLILRLAAHTGDTSDFKEALQSYFGLGEDSVAAFYKLLDDKSVEGGNAFLVRVAKILGHLGAAAYGERASPGLADDVMRMQCIIVRIPAARGESV